MVMHCPNDQTQLAITDRQGVEIDYCPTCRGVWLDRGELDKIIDRAAELYERPEREAPQSPQAPPPQHQQPGYQQPGYQQQGAPYYAPGSQVHRGHPRRRRGFLGEMFDFD